MTTETGQPPKETEANQRVKRRNRGLTVAVVVLALIVMVLAVLVWNDRAAESDLPADVAQVVDDYINAITAQDADAWRETITDSFINRRGDYSAETQKRYERQSYEETADAYAHRIEFDTLGALEYEQLGDRFVTGDGPWYVTTRQRWLVLVEPNQIVFEGNATYVVVDRDGDMKVDAEYFTGTSGFLED